jgi:CheY-like chemotaxis protein
MKTVMVVEDDADIREAVAEALRDDGYDVLEAVHGKHALELLEHMSGQPCLVLLDLMMPVMSGSELLHTLDETHRLATLPVVVLSAGGTPSEATGARHFLRKPPSMELLLHLVREYCH